MRILLLLSLIPSWAFVCPPEMLKAAPVGLPAGSRCGGTCQAYGSCAAGLMCKQLEALPLLGVRAAGECVTKPGGIDLESSQMESIVSHALRLLNARSNNLFMLVPVQVLGAERTDTAAGEVSLDAFITCDASCSHAMPTRYSIWTLQYARMRTRASRC
ncbi:unnamed protein product [Effrenium voratum]|nr:unnamed protein product [Effrenium voratum]CAJ1428493.1 unnamed protein product [Effrenium voratum]